MHILSDAIAEEEEDETPDLCSSNHFILDRIAEKDSTDNLFRAGSETRTESEGGHGAAAGADIRQVNNSLQVRTDNGHCELREGSLTTRCRFSSTVPSARRPT